MLTPTSGDASVYGASILTDMPHIRQSLGVCPQFDILWPEITAREHLTLYAAIKGFRGRDSHAVAERAARDVGESSFFHSAPPMHDSMHAGATVVTVVRDLPSYGICFLRGMFVQVATYCYKWQQCVGMLGALCLDCVPSAACQQSHSQVVSSNPVYRWV